MNLRFSRRRLVQAFSIFLLSIIIYFSGKAPVSVVSVIRPGALAAPKTLTPSAEAVSLPGAAAGFPPRKAPQANPDRSDPIMRLLDLPPSPPESAYEYANPWERKNPPPIPGDDAPVKQLIQYWTRTKHSYPPDSPSDKVKLRFLVAIEKDAELIPDLLRDDLLPDLPEAHDRVKEWLDKRPLLTGNNKDQEDLDEKWDQDRARDWLMLHSRYLRDELIERATLLREVVGSIQNEKELAALAKLDWERAQPILERHVTAGSPRYAALALSLQYKHAVEVGDSTQESAVRDRLREIVADRQAPPYARTKAGDTLLKHDWPGRNEWYLSLFNDHTLARMKENRHSLNPLMTPLMADYKKWAPIVTQLIGHPNRTVHDTVVETLMSMYLFAPETMRPLIPWISDPKWSSAGDNMPQDSRISRERLMGDGCGD